MPVNIWRCAGNVRVIVTQTTIRLDYIVEYPVISADGLVGRRRWNISPAHNCKHKGKSHYQDQTVQA
jgi:hypothetical protein